MPRCFKIRYRDQLAAKLALAKVHFRDSGSRFKNEIRVYRCADCRGWHLTSKVMKGRERR